MTEPEIGRDDPSRTVLITALVVAVAAVSVILGIAVTQRGRHRPVVIPAVSAPHAGDPACRALLNKLPERLGEYQRTPIVQPAPDGTAAWRIRPGGAPVVLRCGLDRPADFVVGFPIQIVDSVQWFEIQGEGNSTWYTADRPVYVALTLPPGSGPTPIQQLSDLIDETIAAVPINPAPAR